MPGGLLLFYQCMYPETTGTVLQNPVPDKTGSESPRENKATSIFLTPLLSQATPHACKARIWTLIKGNQQRHTYSAERRIPTAYHIPIPTSRTVDSLPNASLQSHVWFYPTHYTEDKLLLYLQSSETFSPLLQSHILKLLLKLSVTWEKSLHSLNGIFNPKSLQDWRLVRKHAISEVCT